MANRNVINPNRVVDLPELVGIAHQLEQQRPDQITDRDESGDFRQGGTLQRIVTRIECLQCLLTDITVRHGQERDMFEFAAELVRDSSGIK